MTPPSPAVAFHMIAAHCIADLRAQARKRVPRAFFDYVEAGSYAEQTLRVNCEDFGRVRLRQRVMVDVSVCDTSVTVLGEPLTLPMALAPIGMCGLQYGNGEIVACRAAHAAGIQFTLSTMSICSIEDVAAAVRKPFWFQLYVMKDRGFVRSLIERAAAAGCSALVLTVDLPMMGQRHADLRNGLSVPPSLRLRSLVDMLAHPRWLGSVARSRRWTFGNLQGYVKGIDGVVSLAQWVGSQFDSSLNWNDVAWIRSLWPGPLIIKGVLDPEDARAAARVGADAVVVSNHGGRQLDGAQSSIAALPGISDAIGGEVEVLLDSGVRSGQDVLRALALGARAVLIGRAYVYGLGAAGEAGVARAIGLIRRELEVTMALTGVDRVSSIGPHVLAA